MATITTYICGCEPDDGPQACGPYDTNTAQDFCGDSDCAWCDDPNCHTYHDTEGREWYCTADGEWHSVDAEPTLDPTELLF